MLVHLSIVVFGAEKFVVNQFNKKKKHKPVCYIDDVKVPTDAHTKQRVISPIHPSPIFPSHHPSIPPFNQVIT